MRHLALFLMLLAMPAMAAELPPDEGGGEAASEAPAETAKEAAKPAPEPTAATADATADATAPMPEIKTATEFNAVILQGLNKVTGKISRIRAQLGKAERFGTIEILAHRCWQASPEDRPEHAALLSVQEFKPDEAPAHIFQGWMFSSSPGLSALEHPVYDVTVLTCESPAKAPAAAPAAKPAAPAKP